MSSYFAEAEIKKRLTRYYRRRFVFILHILLTLAIFMVGVGHGIYMQELSLRYASFSSGWTEVAIAISLALIPFLLHGIYVYYREKLEKAIEREILSTSSMRLDKHKYSADEFVYWTDDAVSISDDGELFLQNDLEQGTLKNKRTV